MLPRDQVLAWRSTAPWADEGDVEQDLVITRVLFDVFSDSWLSGHLAFRGGTALHRLYLSPAARYSDDIDLVQRAPEPIGPTFDRLKALLKWVGKPRTEVGEHPKVVFSFITGTESSRRLKLEINTHEHFGTVTPVTYKVEHEVLTGNVAIPSYALSELLGTKLRALYQRKKGRDLFDFWWAREQAEANDEIEFDAEAIVAEFERYMGHSGNAVPSAPELRLNLDEKRQAGTFEEVAALLRTDVTYDPAVALEWFEDTFLRLLRNDDGKRWFSLPVA